MSIKVQLSAQIPYYLSPGDEFLITFDISSWLGTDQIASVAYSASDETGAVDTTCYDSTKSSYTATVFKPYIKAGAVNAKAFVLECVVTTLLAYKKSFYVIIKVNEDLAQNY
jgi:hypothetical protein